VLLQKIVLKATGEVAADAQITFVISDKSGRAVVLEGEVLRQIQRIAPKA
jgi:acyl-CoA thioesterase FadM